MKPKHLIFGFLLLVISINAAPEDYVKLYANGCNGDFGEVTCFTVYNITNPTNFPITIDTSNFKIKFRSKLNPELVDFIQSLKNTNLERWNGFQWVNLNLGGSVILAAKTSYLIKFSGQRVWQKTGFGSEEYLEDLDNVISAFGNNYTQYAWWNATFPYRRQINISNPNGNYTPAVVNISFDSSTPIGQGKMQSDCDDLRFTYLNESNGTEYPLTHYLYADAGLYSNTVGKCNGGNLNALAHVRIPYLQNGTTSIYYYYGNSTVENVQTNATYFFFELFNAPVMNITSWDNGTTPQFLTVCGGCVLNAGYYHVEGLGTVGVLRLNNVTYTESFYYNKSFLLAYRISEVTSINRIAFGDDGVLGWSLTNTMNLMPPSFNMLEVSVNQTRIWVINGTRITLAGNNWGADKNNYLGFYSPGTSTSADVTNITAVTYFNSPLIFSPGSEESQIAGSGNFNLNAYDDSTLLPIYFNATFQNDTISYVTSNTISYTNASVNLPQNTVTITIKNSSYYDGLRIQAISNDTINLNVYLLPKSNQNIFYVPIYVQDLSGIGLNGASVHISRYFNNTYNVIYDLLTDSTGTTSAFLDLTQTYLFSISKSGYSSKQATVHPTTLGVTFFLTTNANPTYSSEMIGIYHYISPDQLNNSRNWTIINYTIVADNNDLTIQGLNISNNGILIYASEVSTTSGQSLLVNVSTASRTGTIVALGYFKKTGPTQLYYKNYLISSDYGFPWSLTSLSESIRNSGEGTFTMFVLIVLLTMVALSGAGYTLGAGVFAVAILGFLSVFIIPFSNTGFWLYFFGPLVLVAIAIVQLKGRF